MAFAGLVVAAVLAADVMVPDGDVELLMKDGTTVSGKVVARLGDRVLIQTADGKRVRVAAKEVVDARSVTPAVRPTPTPTPKPTSRPTAGFVPAPSLAAYERKLVEANPRTADAWRQFGQWCIVNRFAAQARAAYKKSLALDPKDARVRQEELAERLEQAGLRYEAQEELAALIRANPDDQPLRGRFAALTAALDKEIDDLVTRIQTSYRAKAYADVLDVLDPKVRGAHPVFLENLAVKVERATGVPLDELMVNCRLELPCPTCRGRNPSCADCFGTGLALRGGVTDLERPLLVQRLQRKGDAAYQKIPAYLATYVTNPAYARAVMFTKAQRDGYVKAAEEARAQYAILLRLLDRADEDAKAPFRSKIRDLNKTIEALKNMKVR